MLDFLFNKPFSIVLTGRVLPIQSTTVFVKPWVCPVKNMYWPTWFLFWLIAISRKDCTSMIRLKTYRQFEHKDLQIISNTVNTPRVGFWFGFLFNFRRQTTISSTVVSSTAKQNKLSNMQLIIVLIIAIVASASAFAPRSFARSSSVKSMVRFSLSQLQVTTIPKRHTPLSFSYT